MLMTAALIWMTAQLGSPLRRCHELQNGNTLCICDKVVTLYGPGKRKKLSARIKSSDMDLIEDSAEDLYEDAQRNEWDRALSQVSTLERSVCRVLDEGNSDAPELDMRTVRLEEEVVGRRRTSTMEDANEITRILADLETTTHPHAAPALDVLGYYGRKLEVEIVQGDATLLRHTVGDLRRDWNEIRPALGVATGGRKASIRFDAIVSRLERARNVADFRPLVPTEQEEAENLEKVFAHGDKD